MLSHLLENYDFFLLLSWYKLMLLSRQAAQAMLLELEQGTDTGGTETRSHFSDFGKKKKNNLHYSI